MDKRTKYGKYLECLTIERRREIQGKIISQLLTNPVTLQTWELTRFKRQPSKDNQERIARIVGVEPSKLFEL